jgi:gamma-glutamyltranspeptidase
MDLATASREELLQLVGQLLQHIEALEARIAELERRGHRVEVWDEWTPRMGALCAIRVDEAQGTLLAGADLRRDGYAIGR